MIWWHVVLVLAVWGALCAGAGVAAGTEARNRLRDDAEAAYNHGWDDSALAHTVRVDGKADALTAILSTGRRPADDEIPGPLPAQPMMCPGGRRCVRGPEPHQWSADCEEDEGWSDEWSNEPAAGEEWADTLRTMRKELAAEAERPASHTDQFRAVFSRADGLERQCLLTWDAGRRFDRGRPEYLRSMGISDKRIRELLGAE
jgi:hypothetical protein